MDDDREMPTTEPCEPDLDRIRKDAEKRKRRALGLLIVPAAFVLAIIVPDGFSIPVILLGMLVFACVHWIGEISDFLATFKRSRGK